MLSRALRSTHKHRAVQGRAHSTGSRRLAQAQGSAGHRQPVQRTDSSAGNRTTRTEHSQCRGAGSRAVQGQGTAHMPTVQCRAQAGSARAQAVGATGSGEGGGGLFVTRMGRLFLAPSRKFLNFSRLAPARTALPAPAHCRPPRPQRPRLLLPGILAA
jgi:hypothetical protein